MPAKTRIVLSIVASLFIVILITKWFFLSDSPRINIHFIRLIPTKTKQFIPKLAEKKVVPTRNPTSTTTTTSAPAPTWIIGPGKPTPTDIPFVYPTSPPPAPSATPRVNPTSPPSSNCALSGNSYGSIKTVSDYTLGKPAAEHPEINLALRGYTMINETKSTVHYGGDTDPNAQKINSLFADGRRPTIINTYCVYAWDYSNNVRSVETECGTPPVKWPVTLIGLATTSGEKLVIPPSGWQIGGGNTLMVLYVDNNRITFTNSTGDNWTDGYTMHVEDVCVDPGLVAEYNRDDAAGRRNLPALPTGAVFGYSKTGEVKVAIRDSGVFMDPRSDKDWW